MHGVISSRKSPEIAAAPPHCQGNGLGNDTFLQLHMEKHPTPGQVQPRVNLHANSRILH